MQENIAKVVAITINLRASVSSVYAQIGALDNRQ